MDLKTIIAVTPWLRKAWKRMPSFMKPPLLAVAFVVGVWYFARGRKSDGETEPSTDEEEPTDAAA